MIRQAISCDICGTEMQNSNHWFVVYDRGVEFRMSRWNARTRLRAGARHLCGQTCLHKLVDDFMARTLSERSPAAIAEKPAVEKKSHPVAAERNDRSLTATAAYAIPARPAPVHDPCIDAYDSSAGLIAPIESDRARDLDLGAMTPTFNSRAWRAEAWKREQQRSALQPATTCRRSSA